jgi:hypothetical protein
MNKGNVAVAASSAPPPGPPAARRAGCGLVLIALLILAVGGGFWAWRATGVRGAGIPVRISADALEAGLQKAFPVDKRELFLGIHLSDPTVALNAADIDRIGFGASVGVSAGGRKLANGTLTAAGKLRYKASSGTFYLDDPEIKTLDIDRISGGEANAVRKAVSYVLRKVVRHLPVYQLDLTDPMQRYAKSAIKSVEVSDGAVVVRFGQS